MMGWRSSSAHAWEVAAALATRLCVFGELKSGFWVD